MQRALATGAGQFRGELLGANELAAMGRTRDAEVRIDAALVNDPGQSVAAVLQEHVALARRRSGRGAGVHPSRRCGGSAFGALMLEFYDAAHGDMAGSCPAVCRFDEQDGHDIPPRICRRSIAALMATPHSTKLR